MDGYVGALTLTPCAGTGLLCERFREATHVDPTKNRFMKFGDDHDGRETSGTALQPLLRSVAVRRANEQEDAFAVVREEFVPGWRRWFSKRTGRRHLWRLRRSCQGSGGSGREVAVRGGCRFARESEAGCLGSLAQCRGAGGQGARKTGSVLGGIQVAEGWWSTWWVAEAFVCHFTLNVATNMDISTTTVNTVKTVTTRTSFSVARRTIK